jgi:hypothetical protein
MHTPNHVCSANASVRSSCRAPSLMSKPLVTATANLMDRAASWIGARARVGEEVAAVQVSPCAAISSMRFLTRQ